MHPELALFALGASDLTAVGCILPQFGGVTATSYDIEWAEHSYASRAPTGGGGFDYSLVRANTHPLLPLTTYLPMQFQGRP